MLSKYEKLSHIQLQQKIIHLESEISFYRADKEKQEKHCFDQVAVLRQDNDRLKKQIQELLYDNEAFSDERDELIKDYNELLMTNKEFQNKILQLEKSIVHPELQEKLKKFSQDQVHFEQKQEELKLQINDKDKIIEELEETAKNLKHQLAESSEERGQFHQLCKKIKIEKEQLELKLADKVAELEIVQQEMAELQNEKGHLQSDYEHLQKDFLESENQCKLYRKNEKSLMAQIEKLNNGLFEAVQEKNEFIQKINVLLQELGKNNELLIKASLQNQKLGEDLQVLKEIKEQLHQKNVSYQQKINQLESEKNAALESVGHLQAELSHAEAQLLELGDFKTEMLNRLESRVKEMSKLEEENNRFINEKTDLLHKIAKLEKENASFHESISIMSSQRQSDEERLDNITADLNEVFAETKQLVRMTSSLKHQLEAKTLELNQMKKEKDLLMEEVLQLRQDYEKSEAKKSELENQIDIMRTELFNAQHSLSRLEQFETEKLRLKDDLESKIEEFNMLTDHYQREKESYLHVLEHVQEQVDVYKQKTESFDSEKGSWSKQIDELKAELAHTKATIVHMEELEQKNAALTAEIQSKELEMYKKEKESERLLHKQIEQFQAEFKLYQDKIMQYEKDREIWEKQMKQMKVQFAALESSLEEKENFIKQYIKQPLTFQPTNQFFSQSEQNSKPVPQPVPSPVTQPEPQHVSQQIQTPAHHPVDWFNRLVSQQQVQGQSVKEITNANPATMDFFTLRNKTAQPSTQQSPQSPIYGSQ